MRLLESIARGEKAIEDGRVLSRRQAKARMSRWPKWSGPSRASPTCIALDVPDAARQRVRRVFDHVEQLAAHPDSGSKPSELEGWRYRQWLNRRAGFQRHDRGHVHVLHVMRAEQQLRTERLGRSAGARPR